MFGTFPKADRPNCGYGRSGVLILNIFPSSDETRGPPLLPGLIAASVWMIHWPKWLSNLVAEIIPSVTVAFSSRAKG